MSIDYLSLLPEGYSDDPDRGPVYAAAPSPADDLTQIHGIGEVLEAQLNLNGIYRLEQIANWDQQNIAAFSDLMPCFQDRIERNYWILQAQRIIERRQQSDLAAADAGAPSSLFQTMVVMSLSLLIGLLLVRWLEGGAPQTYAGYLRARTFHVAASTTGDVSRVLVREGDQVLENQEVVRLRDTALDDARTAAKSHLAIMQHDLDQALAKAELDLTWRLRELDGEILEHRRAIAEVEARNARPQNPRIEPLVPATTASLTRRNPFLFFNASGNQTVRLTRTAQMPVVQRPRELRPGEAGAAQLSLAQQRIAELEKLKKDLRDSVQRAGGVQSAEAARDRAQATLDQLNSATDDITMTASGFGIISKCLRHEGDHVNRGEPVLELVDSREQHVSALIPSQDVDGLEPGMKASLYFPGNQHRRGRVVSLPVRTSTQQRGGESTVEIRIEPMGGLWPAVPIGSQVRVAID